MPPKPSYQDAPAPSRSHLVAPLLAGGVLAMYVAGIFFLPHELPALTQRAVGLGFALLTAVFVLAVTRRREPPEMLMQRVRLAQHSDFGKQLYTMPASRRHTVQLPLLGRVRLRTLAGAGVFCVAAAAWWLSPWPIRVKNVVLEDMTIPLAEDLVAPLLVATDPYMAVLQTPVVPLRARQLAGMIPDGSMPYSLALRALGRQQFDDARALLTSARQAPGADPAQIALAEAQLAMYAGRFADAVQAYGKLVEQRPDDPMLRCQLAVACMQAGQFAAADELVEQATTITERLQPASAPEAAVCLHLQALVRLNRGRGFDKAEAAARESQEIWKKAGGDHPARLAATLNNRACLLLLRGDCVGAEELLDQARGQWSLVPDERDPHVAAACDNLAIIHRVLGRHQQAQQALDSATKIYQQQQPAAPPLLALNLAVASCVGRGWGHDAKALADAGKALVLAQKGLSNADHPYLAAILDNLMAVDTGQARYAEAYAHGSRASTLIKQLWGDKHPYLAMNLDGLAQVEIAEGKLAAAQDKTEVAQDHFARAEKLCGDALAIVQHAFGPKFVWVAEIQYTRARLEIARDAPYNARPYLEEARKIWETAFLGIDYPPLVSVLGDLASLDDDSTLITAGIAEAQQAVELAERIDGSENPELARLLCILAVLDRKKGDYAAAAKCLDRALEIRKAALPPSHPDLAVTLEIYASVLRKMTPPENDRAAEMEASAKDIRARHAKEDRLP